MTLSSDNSLLRPSSEGRASAATGTQDARVLVFIPSLNDRDLLHQLATSVLELGAGFVVLVIDDGSEPSIEKTLLPENCLLFTVPSNVGLGLCTHIAFDHALMHNYDFVVRLDADGQHPIAMIPD